VVGFLIVFCAIIFFAPDMGGYFLEYNNFVPANPMKTPEHIAPVWYFTPYYAILRAVPPMFGSQFPGVVAMGVATVIFFAPAVAGSRQGQVDSLSRSDLQGVPGFVRGEFRRFGLSWSDARHPDIHPCFADFVGCVLRILLPDALVHQDRQVQARA